jgi:hypothetical protein
MMDGRSSETSVNYQSTWYQIQDDSIMIMGTRANIGTEFSFIKKPIKISELRHELCSYPPPRRVTPFIGQFGVAYTEYTSL